MAHFTISLTHIVMFLMVTGILTWTILAIVGVWHVLTWLEQLCDRVTQRKRLVRIYRHG